MIKRQLVVTIGKDKDGKDVEIATIETVLDRKSGEPIVTEDRAATPFRALPRLYREKIVGEPGKGVVGFLESKAWLPIYQRYDNGIMTGLQCWKCQREIVGWMPALRRPATWKPGQQDELILVGGQPAVSLTCHTHYLEGSFGYRRADGVASSFSYLHCADCTITDADGENLLSCFLAGHDNTRNTLNLYTNDEWALWMWRWSNIELMRRLGPSQGPGDLMQKRLKRGNS